jgi:hypothetical protein
LFGLGVTGGFFESNQHGGRVSPPPMLFVEQARHPTAIPIAHETFTIED